MAYRMTLFVHVMAVIMWLGVGIAFQMLVERTASSSDNGKIATIVSLGEAFGKAFFGVLTGVVLLSGLLMVFLGSWGFDNVFIIGGLIGILASGAIGGTVLGPTSERLEQRIRVNETAPSEVASDLLRLRNAGRADLAIMTFVVFLMTVKPGL